jgi:hypothetical protein
MLCFDLKGGEMAETARQTPAGFLTMAEARAQLGVSKMTMARMVRAAGVKTYDDPRDARIKLLRAKDVEEMGHPTIALRPILESWQESYVQTDEQLAEYLHMPLENLSSLKAARLKTVPGTLGWRAPGEDFYDTNDPNAADLQAIAVRHDADPARLFEVFMGDKVAAGKAAA